MESNEAGVILLVEDTQSAAEMTIRAIRKTKVSSEITHLQDGKEAIDYLFGSAEYAGRDVSLKPRVILLDLKMPRLNGIEVLELIKADDCTKKIPVVILTSSEESPDIEKCYELGVNSFIVKPVDAVEFASTLGLYWTIHNQSTS